MSTQPRRLSVDKLRPRDAILEIDGVDYEIRGDIPIEGMISLLMVHKRLEAVTGTSEDDALEALKAVEEANHVIVGIIRERHPDANIPPLGLPEVTGILGFLAGNVQGPIAEVEETLVLGVPEPTEEAIQARIQAEVERLRMVEAGEIPDIPPTIPSRSDSSTPSSTSESSTSGPPNGGSESHGEPSPSTANTPTAA